MVDKSLSQEMAACLYNAVDHGGKLIRHPGGYWTWPDCPRHAHNGLPHVYWGTSTVQGLMLIRFEHAASRG